MPIILYYLVLIWLAWLIVDALRSGSIWIKGGSSDRFTRDLDMHSFAHKVNREDSPSTYWIMIIFYTAIAMLFLYLISIN